MEMSVIDHNHPMQIEVEPFDREYELSELLPIKTLEELCYNAARLPGQMAAARHCSKALQAF